jgi:hypothetical protein
MCQLIAWDWDCSARDMDVTGSCDFHGSHNSRSRDSSVTVLTGLRIRRTVPEIRAGEIELSLFEKVHTICGGHIFNFSVGNWRSFAGCENT